MKTSENGLDLIKQFEGYRDTAYKCPAGVWTIGWGHTKGVKEGDRIDTARAEELLSSDLQVFEKAVNDADFPSLTQNQFDALVALTYNIGPSNFRYLSGLRQTE